MKTLARWALHANTSVLRKERQRESRCHTQREERNMKMQVEMEYSHKPIQPQTKSLKRQEMHAPKESPKGPSPADTSTAGFWSPELREN